MSDLIAIISLALGLALILGAVASITNGVFDALRASMLGMGVLVLIDIPKYKYLDSFRVGWIGDEAYQEAAFLIWLSTFLIFAAYIMSFSKKRFTRRRSNIEYKKLTRTASLLRVVLIPGSLALAAVSQQSGYDGLASGIMRGATVSLVIWGIYARDRTSIIIGAIALVLLVDDSSRRAYIAIFVPLLIAIGILFRTRFGSIRSSVKVGILVSGIVAFVFLNALRANHNYGAGFDPNDPVGNTVHYTTELTSIDTFFNTAFIVSKFPTPWEFYYGETYVSVPVAIIPRSLWPEKPVSLASQLGLMVRYNYRGFDDELWRRANMFSLSPGFVGEAYANFGLLGVVCLSILLGALAGRIDSRINFRKFDLTDVPRLMFLSSFILIHRGDFYTAVFYQCSMFVGAYAFMRAMHGRQLRSRGDILRRRFVSMPKSYTREL